VTATGSVEVAVKALNGEVAQLDTDVPALLESVDREGVFVLLGLLQRTEADLGKVRAAVEAKAAGLMTKGTERWPDGTIIERETRWREVWDHRGAALAAVDPLVRDDAGDLDPRLVAVVDGLLRAMTPSWRTTVLGARATEDNRLRERTRHAVKVTLPTAGGAA
jgi:hypothetical protein